MTAYSDLASLPEDERIEIIGKACRAGKRTAVFLERNLPDKIDRYIKKLSERYPDVELVDRQNGPTPRIVSLVFDRRPM